MFGRERMGGHQPLEPLVQLPTEASDYDLHRIEVYLRTKSLGASVSQVIVDEASTLMSDELSMWDNLDYETHPDPFDPDLIICWDGYQRPALAYLNAEEVLRGKLPFEDPARAIRKAVGDKELVARLLGIELDEEVIAAQTVAQWHVGIGENLNRLLRTGSPVDLIDTIVANELANPQYNLTDSVYYQRDLIRGQTRYHQLYNAGLPLFELKKLGMPTK